MAKVFEEEGSFRNAQNTVWAVKKSLPQLGYRLAESGRERVGHAVVQGARRLRSDQLASNGKNRKQVKDETWIWVSLQPYEIEHSHKDVGSREGEFGYSFAIVRRNG